MKRVILLLSFLLSISVATYSQIFVDKNGNIYDQRQKRESEQNGSQKKEPLSSSFDKSKVSVGGNFSLQFGDYTVIGISPQVGYDFSKYVTLGAGFGYTHFREKIDVMTWKANYLSFNLFGRFYPVEYIVLSIQPEISRMWEKVDNSYTGNFINETYMVPSLLVGGGLYLNGVTAMLQYDLAQDNKSPYGSGLFYSVGYTFRF